MANVLIAISVNTIYSNRRVVILSFLNANAFGIQNRMKIYANTSSGAEEFLCWFPPTLFDALYRISSIPVTLEQHQIVRWQLRNGNIKSFCSSSIKFAPLEIYSFFVFVLIDCLKFENNKKELEKRTQKRHSECLLLKVISFVQETHIFIPRGMVSCSAQMVELAHTNKKKKSNGIRDWVRFVSVCCAASCHTASAKVPFRMWSNEPIHGRSLAWYKWVVKKNAMFFVVVVCLAASMQLLFCSCESKNRNESPFEIWEVKTAWALVSGIPHASSIRASLRLPVHTQRNTYARSSPYRPVEMRTY